MSYLDSYGNRTDLGAPTMYMQGGIAASVGVSGGTEVFDIGADGYIYVNKSNTYGDWQLVDNRAQFTSLSATPNDTVFAVTSAGKLYQEIELVSSGWFPFDFWIGQDISGGRTWGQISADTDAVGRDEVYAVDWKGNAYLYNQGSWTWKDASVYDLSAAGDGYFYDVDYSANNSHYAYQWNPSNGWTYLGYGLS